MECSLLLQAVGMPMHILEAQTAAAATRDEVYCRNAYSRKKKKVALFHC